MIPGVGKIPWSGAWPLTPVFLPGESHGWRSPAGCSLWGCKRVRHDQQLRSINSDGGKRGRAQLVLKLTTFSATPTPPRLPLWASWLLTSTPDPCPLLLWTGRHASGPHATRLCPVWGSRMPGLHQVPVCWGEGPKRQDLCWGPVEGRTGTGVHS